MNPDRAGQAPIAPEIADQAVRWLLELQDGSVSETVRQGWQRWLEQSPEHQRAWQYIEAVNLRLKDLPRPLSHAVLGRPRKNGRRRSLKLLMLIATGGAAGWVAKDARFVQAWGADYSTAVGELRTVELTDGTSVTLDTDSAMNVRFDDARRVVRLVRGKIMVTTAADRRALPRPFLVATGQGSARAIGTRFSVQVDGGASAVAVFEGLVEIRPEAQPESALMLPAGQQATFTRDGHGNPSALDESAGAWAAGMIVASNMRLDAFLAELSRYRAGQLRCAPEVASLRVSGTYPLADTDRILAALERALPVKAQRFTRYWVLLHAAG